MSRLRNIDKKLVEQLIDTDDQVDIINEFTDLNDYNFKLYSKILSWLFIVEIILFCYMFQSIPNCLNVLSITCSWFQLKYTLYRRYLLATNGLIQLIILTFIINGNYSLAVSSIDFVIINCLGYWYNQMKKDVDDLNRLKYKYKSV